MATCLVALGSNSGNREAALRDALAEMDAAVGPVRRHSRLYRSRPVGGPAGQEEFLNAVAEVETAIAPLPLVELLQGIEARHTRQRSERWAARTLDLDLLVYDEQVMDTAVLIVPHPRMSFRRFVLEPAAEIAGQLVHPTIGWTIDRLLYHLDAAANQVAILSQLEDQRRQLATLLADRFEARTIARPTGDGAPPLWPPELTTWVSLDHVCAGGLPAYGERSAPAPTAEYLLGGRPKLTIVLDTAPPPSTGAPLGSEVHASAAGRPSKTSPDWSTLRLWHDRGPTLMVRTTDPQEIRQEAFAAIEAVWPELCPPAQNA